MFEIRGPHYYGHAGRSLCSRDHSRGVDSDESSTAVDGIYKACISQYPVGKCFRQLEVINLVQLLATGTKNKKQKRSGCASAPHSLKVGLWADTCAKFAPLTYILGVCSPRTPSYADDYTPLLASGDIHCMRMNSAAIGYCPNTPVYL